VKTKRKATIEKAHYNTVTATEKEEHGTKYYERGDKV
jgi:hypothetical protein